MPNNEPCAFAGKNPGRDLGEAAGSSLTLSIETKRQKTAISPLIILSLADNERMRESGDRIHR